MTLSERIAIGSRRASRIRQQRAERRLDEIVTVAGIAEDYAAEDRRGDAAIEVHFRSLYALVNSPEEKQAVAAAFTTWQKCEQREDVTVHRSVGVSVDLLRTNNDYWLDDGCGPDGRAA